MTAPLPDHPVTRIGDSRERRLEARIAQMIAEACAALGIAPEGDDAERWGAALEAMKAKRTAVEAVGYLVVDRLGLPYRYEGGQNPRAPRLYEPADIDLAEGHRDSLNRIGGAGPLALRQPFRVVPVGPAQPAEPRPAAITLTIREMLTAIAFAAPDGDAPQFPEDDAGTSLTFEHLPERESIEGGTLPAGLWCWLAEYPDEGCFPLFDFEEEVSPPDRPAEAPEPKAGGTDLADQGRREGLDPSARRRRSWDRD